MNTLVWQPSSVDDLRGTRTKPVPPRRSSEPVFTSTRRSELFRTSQATLALSQEVYSILDWLATRGIVVLRDKEVRLYLQQYPKLADLLRIYAEKVSEEFPDASIEVDLYQDPEEDDRYLVMYVRYKQYPENIIDRVHELRRHLRPQRRAILGEDAGLLFLMTDFQPPGTL